MRKKISTNETLPPASVDLDDDEQFVKEVTTTTKIAREKKKAKPEAENAPEIIDAEIIEDDSNDLPEFEEESLASLIYGTGDDDETDISEQYCSVVPRRLKDHMGDKFAKPCNEVQTLETLAAVPLVATREEIQDRVRREHGSGGRFFFQVRFANRLQRSWQAVLGDPSGLNIAAVGVGDVEKSVVGHYAPVPPPVVANTGDPLDTLIAGFRKQDELRNLILGGDVNKYETQITELKAELASLRDNPHEPKSEKLALLETALASQSSDAQSRILNHLFPSDEPEKRHWLADTISVVLENKDAIVGALGGLLGGGTPAMSNGQSSQSEIEQLMRGQPPPPIPKNLNEPATALPATEVGWRKSEAVNSELVAENDVEELVSETVVAKDEVLT